MHSRWVLDICTLILFNTFFLILCIYRPITRCEMCKLRVDIHPTSQDPPAFSFANIYQILADLRRTSIDSKYMG